MEPLEQPYEAYWSVFLTWLKTPNLTSDEVQMIQSLLKAYEEGPLQFDLARAVSMSNPVFISMVQSAARKAMDAGLLLSWKHHAETA